MDPMPGRRPTRLRMNISGPGSRSRALEACAAHALNATRPCLRPRRSAHCPPPFRPLSFAPVARRTTVAPRIKACLLALALLTTGSESFGGKIQLVFPIPLPPLPPPPVVELGPRRPPVPPTITVPPIVHFPLICGGVIDVEDIPPLGLIDLFGSVAAFETALAATRIELVELQPKTDWSEPAREKPASPIALDANDRALLRRFLTTDASFAWGKLSSHYPDFRGGIRVRLKHVGQVVTIDLFLRDGIAQVTTAEHVVATSTLEMIPKEVVAMIERLLPALLE